MDFDQLRTLLEVAKLGNFSRAAEKVLRSQPAVSAQIRQLEQEYGQKLFDRSAKRVRLTPAGEVVRDYGQQMLVLGLPAIGYLLRLCPILDLDKSVIQ
jgi:DNA-binding transcriptional LysR family regulator